MSVEKIYSIVTRISPHLEVFLRRIYWRNIKTLKRFKPKNNNTNNKKKIKSDFFNIINYLKKQGVIEGSLMIIHSSYDSLGGTNLSPKEIIDNLLTLVGEDGTIAMPVIRKYKGEPKEEDILQTNIDNLNCKYDVKKSMVISGMLPYALMNHTNSVTSRFPLNPLTAVGKLAKDMMKKNLDGENPSPHGHNSSWKFCLDNNAIILGLGIDLAHHLTILHVIEEAFNDWPIEKKEWFRLRSFDIKDGDFQETKVVSERRPHFGMIYLAEKKLKRDLLKRKILTEEIIDNIRVSLVHSRELVAFLKMQKKTYPYYI